MRFCSIHRYEYFADCPQCIEVSKAKRSQREEACLVAQQSALDTLRETCGMYCERLPDEVREALHAIPGIEKTHNHKEGKPMWARMYRGKLAHYWVWRDGEWESVCGKAKVSRRSAFDGTALHRCSNCTKLAQVNSLVKQW